jgi:uncharacterized membrane protein
VRFEASIEVAAPAEQVFDVYFDVERWPQWTPTVTSVERLDQGPLRIGARTRVRQPRLPKAVWEVTDIAPGRSFTWVATGPGIRTTGHHEAEPTGDGRCRITARLLQEGWLGAVVGRLTSRLTDRYLQTEVHGLKAFCERSSTGSS